MKTKTSKLYLLRVLLYFVLSFSIVIVVWVFLPKTLFDVVAAWCIGFCIGKSLIKLLKLT